MTAIHKSSHLTRCVGGREKLLVASESIFTCFQSWVIQEIALAKKKKGEGVISASLFFCFWILIIPMSENELQGAEMDQTGSAQNKTKASKAS